MSSINPLLERIAALYRQATSGAAALEAVDRELGGGKVGHGTRIRILQDIGRALIPETATWEIFEPKDGVPMIVFTGGTL